MTGRFQSATQYLFILTEAVGWFIVIRVLATTIDHGALTRLLREIESGVGGPADDPRVLAAAAVLREAVGAVTSGPSVLVIVFAAFAAFFLSRVITQLRLPRSLAAMLGILASVVMLNVVLHAALAGDLLFWDSGGLSSFLDDPEAQFAARGDAAAFVTDPEPGAVRGASLGLIVFGLFALWARFLLVGRGTVHFERSMRSFSVGFPIVMLAALASRVTGVSAGMFALPYFVLGMLTLAVANVERSAGEDGQLPRPAPWAIAALVSMGLLAMVAALFGLVAVLEVEQVLAPIGSVVMRFVTWALIIAVTPVVWVIEAVLTRLFSNANFDALSQLIADPAPTEGLEDRDRSFRWPGWLTSGIRLALVTLLGYAVYRVARFLFFGRPGREQERGYAEERGTTATSAGLGSLLRNLVPGRRRRPDMPQWLARAAAYRLFARAVNAAEDRGFPRRPGETPLEFSTVAARALDASAVFPGIAAEFDRARYGRHYATAEALGPLDRALGEWERMHPVTEELRKAVARDKDEARPLPRELPDDMEMPPDVLPPEML